MKVVKYLKLLFYLGPLSDNLMVWNLENLELRGLGRLLPLPKELQPTVDVLNKNYELDKLTF